MPISPGVLSRNEHPHGVQGTVPRQFAADAVARVGSSGWRDTPELNDSAGEEYHGRESSFGRRPLCQQQPVRGQAGLRINDVIVAQEEESELAQGAHDDRRFVRSAVHAHLPKVSDATGSGAAPSKGQRRYDLLWLRRLGD